MLKIIYFWRTKAILYKDAQTDCVMKTIIKFFTPFHLFVFTTLIYLFFIIYVAFYNRLASDDYYFKAKVLEYGFFKSLFVYYTSWQGRFGAHLLINTIIFFNDILPMLFIYSIALLGLYLYSISQILKHILPITQVSPLILYSVSLLILGVFLITVYDISSFYWLNASAMYFGGIAFALLGISKLLSPSHSFLSYSILIFSFVIAGSSSESFSFIFNILLISYLLYQKLYLKVKIPTKYWVGFVCCFISFLLMVTAEGNQVRRSAFPEISVTYALFRSVKYVYYTILAMIAQRAIFFLVLSVMMIYVGAFFRKESSINEEKCIRLLLTAVPLFIGLLIISVFPNVYAMGGIGAYRSLTHINFYTVVFFSVLSFFIGYYTNFSKKIAQMLASIGTVTFLIMANDLRIQLHYTKQYVISEDARTAHLKKLKEQGFKGKAILKPLYDSPYNLLVINEINKSSLFYTNKCITQAEQLGFEIELFQQSK